jgi:hypothetical protein
MHTNLSQLEDLREVVHLYDGRATANTFASGGSVG